MIILKTEVNVNNITGKQVYDFMLNSTDNDYQRWWPGTHIAFRTIKRYAGNIGNLVYFDEYVGERRLKFNAIVTEAISGKKITWQMDKVIKLPGWLALEFEDIENGVRIIHTLSLGYKGIGKIFDKVLELYLSKKFQMDLDEHAKTEFPMLAKMLV